MYFLNTESFTCDIVRKSSQFRNDGSLKISRIEKLLLLLLDQLRAKRRFVLDVYQHFLRSVSGREFWNCAALVLGQKKEKGRRKRRLVCGGETGPVHGNYAHSKRVSPCCRRRRWMKIITRPSSCNLGRRLFRFRDRESKKGGRRGERKEEIRHFLDATLGLIKRKTSALFLCGLFWDAPSLLFEGRDDNRGNEAREKKRRWFPRSWNETVRRRFQGIF